MRIVLLALTIFVALGETVLIPGETNDVHRGRAPFSH